MTVLVLGSRILDVETVLRSFHHNDNGKPNPRKFNSIFKLTKNTLEDLYI